MYQLESWADPFKIRAIPEIQIKGVTVKGPLYEVARIHFQTGISTLDHGDKSRLKFLSKAYWPLLFSLPIELKFYIVGYADERGGDMKNLELSKLRANTVSAFFERQLLFNPPPNIQFLPRFEIAGAGEVKLDPKFKGEGGISSAGLTRKERLARWRRVSIYSNVSGDPVKAGIKRLSERLRKAAEQATTRFPKHLKNIKELVEMYKKRLGRGANSLTDYNTTFLLWYEVRLKDRLKKYDELKNALVLGDKAFVEWMNTPSRPYAEFVHELTSRLRKEIQRYRIEKETAPKELKPLIQEIIEGLQNDIFFLEDELIHIVVD